MYICWVYFWSVTHLNWMYWLIVWLWLLRCIVVISRCWLGLLFKGDCFKHTCVKWSYPPRFEQVSWEVCPFLWSSYIPTPMTCVWLVPGLSFISYHDAFSGMTLISLDLSSWQLRQFLCLVVSIMSLLVFWADFIDLTSATTTSQPRPSVVPSDEVSLE